MTPAPPIAHTLSRVVVSDHTPIGIPRNVKVHPGPEGRIFDTIDRKLEEVEWLLNYARNANKPIPVAFASTTKKVNAPRRPTPMKLLNPVTHHRKTKSPYVPEINSEKLTPRPEVMLRRWRLRYFAATTESIQGFSNGFRLVPVQRQFVQDYWA